MKYVVSDFRENSETKYVIDTSSIETPKQENVRYSMVIKGVLPQGEKYVLVSIFSNGLTTGNPDLFMNTIVILVMTLTSALIPGCE